MAFYVVYRNYCSLVYKTDVLTKTSVNLECGDGSVAHVHIAFNEHIRNAVVLQRATDHCQHLVPLDTDSTATAVNVILVASSASFLVTT